MNRTQTLRAFVAAGFLASGAAKAGEPLVSYGLAMHGAPALLDSNQPLPYTDPAAAKGGQLTLGVLGGFDGLNPFNVKSLSTAEGLTGTVYQSLGYRSRDEAFTVYPLIARAIETDDSRSAVTFRLDPRAHFSTGEPITSADVAFTFELLKTQGRPQHRAAFAHVHAVSTPDVATIIFDLTGSGDRELPLTLSLMPVLSRKAVSVDRFSQQSLDVPVGSGPYVVAEVKVGESLTLKRDPHYWGRDLPLTRGLANFDEIRTDYYRESGTLFEAFKAGLIDFRMEPDPQRWRLDYDFPALRRGLVVKQTIPVGLPKGFVGFAFNTRREPFTDVRVREALTDLFDFEWIDANLYGGAYKRTRSFFDESELASAGRPASARERELLSPFPDAVRPDVMEGLWAPPVSDGSGRDRKAAAHAIELLRQAGYTPRNGRISDAKGRALAFEILIKNTWEERLALAYARFLKRIGIEATLRKADDSEFARRRTAFEFDVMVASWLATPSPGMEQRGRWSSRAAEAEGSYNVAGARSPAADAMIEKLLAAGNHDDFIAAARALDRVLVSGYYAVPLFHAADQWIAYKADLGRPAKNPMFGVELDAWWRKPK